MGHTTDSAALSARFAQRREQVLRAIGPDAALVLAATPEIVIGRDTELRYIVDPEIYYLTGYQEPEAVIVLAPGAAAPFTMFVRPRDPARELWTGGRGGVEAATERFGAQAAFAIDELPEKLPPLLNAVNTIYARLDAPALDPLVRRAISNGRRLRARDGRGPGAIVDPGVLLDDLRRTKDPLEIEALRRAAELTVAGFRDAVTHIRPGSSEWQVEAALEAGFRAHGADAWAFPSIVAGGANATTLHYISNDQPLRAGDLLLIDAGARFRQYCADMTRTFPVSGRFSAAQRRLYDLVLAAHDAALELARPGTALADLHEAASTILLAGLDALGFTDAGRYYPHKTAHWLGLEVHDVGGYANAVLAEGMVFTIEPGVYIAESDQSAPSEYRGIGIRIEDDVLITATGHEVLTAAMPTSAEAIEALMSGAP